MAAAAAGVRRDVVVVLVQPGLEPRGLRGREDHDLVLADLEARLDLDVAVADRRAPLPASHQLGHRRLSGLVHRTRVLFPVLDQPRRAHLLDMREHVLRQRLDVAFVEHDRHRDHHRERLGRALVVVLHRQHGPRARPHQHDLRRVVEQRLIAACDVEPAERACGGRNRGEDGYERERADHRGELRPLHRPSPWRRSASMLAGHPAHHLVVRDVFLVRRDRPRVAVRILDHRDPIAVEHVGRLAE